MQKDNRTKKERIAAQNRSWKRFLRSSKNKKNKWIRKESISKKKKAEELAFLKHMARLRGEIGAQ